MSKKPFFSVIIPCFNSAEYIGETLDSLLQQTFKNFEIIVVDDGSTDDSLAVCKERLDKYKIGGLIIQRQAHIINGVASCRNLGIKNARADWICFLDSDDLFTPEKLEETYSAIAVCNKTCQAYYHAANKFDNVSHLSIAITNSPQKMDCENILQALLHQNFVVTSTVTIRKSLFVECGGFNTSLHGVEDYLMWLRIAKRTKWHYKATPLVNYRVRPISLMSGRKMKYYVYQNFSLVEAIKQTREFSDIELSIVKQYSNDTMDYYAMNSLATYGWRDFFGGIKELLKTGQFRTACYLLYKHLKQFGLRKARFTLI